MIDMNLMVNELMLDEEVKYSAYQDSLGFWTIGVGRLIDSRKGGRLSQDEVEYLLSNNIQECLEDIQTEPWFLACVSDQQRRGLLNMRFQLGASGIRTFKTSLGLIANGNFKEAGINLRKSLWYSQTKNRAERIIRQITGES